MSCCRFPGKPARIICLTGLAAAVGFMAGCSRPHPPVVATGPRIEFASLVHDFGRVRAGQTYTNEFIFTNTGNATLEVTGVFPSCGCTMAGEWTRRVEPWRTGVIPILYQSPKLVLDTRKIIPVTCNDPVRSNVVLEVKAELWLPVIVFPESVPFVTTEETLEQTRMVVAITNNEPQSLWLGQPVSDNAQFAAELRTNVAGRAYELGLRAVPPLNPMRPAGRFTLTTSSTNEPVLTVTVHRQILPELAVDNPVLALPPAPLAEPMSYSLMVTNRGTNHVEVFEVRMPGTNATARWREVTPGRDYYVELNFPRSFVLPTNQPPLARIRTTHPVERVVDVTLQHNTRP